jgi:N-methylhydantoinase B
MTAPDTTGLDPITFAVVRNGLSSAARAMYQVFKRTATLPILYEFNDFGMSLFDDRVNMIADAPGIPIFVGSLDACIRDTVAEVGGPEALRPGDVLLNNHPYLTAGQPADAALIQPIFLGDRLIGYAALRGHMGDFGAKGPYPLDATELFQEGTLLPALKLHDEGRVNELVLRIVAANSRMPNETVGSILAGVGAVQAASRKLVALVEKHGIETYYATVDALLDHGERVARGVVETIPDGTYVYEDHLDGNGITADPVKLRCAVTIAGSEVTIDLTGSADEQMAAVNCPLGYTLTTCRFALKRLTTPELPASSGEQRPLTVIAPEGSIFNPRPPAGSFIGAYTSLRLTDMILQALAPAVPGIPAENGGDLVMALAYLKQPVSGRFGFFFDIGALGHGATRDSDGMNALIHPIEAGCEAMPTELLETRLPVLKLRAELIPDSGGAGRFRGGLSAESEFEFRSDGLTVLLADKLTSEVKGLEGGRNAPFTNSITLFPGTEREIRAGKVSDVPIAAGDRMVFRPAGGGGHGDPLDREPERVAADVLDEYVTPQAARELYGVVFSDEEEAVVDAEATAALRASMRRNGAG